MPAHTHTLLIPAAIIEGEAVSAGVMSPDVMAPHMTSGGGDVCVCLHDKL